jgi:hypothetical protein
MADVTLQSTQPEPWNGVHDAKGPKVQASTGGANKNKPLPTNSTGHRQFRMFRTGPITELGEM